VAAGDSDTAADAAVQFAQLIMPEPFFSVTKLPDNWETALAGLCRLSVKWRPSVFR
jgi:hypothetical protein